MAGGSDGTLRRSARCGGAHAGGPGAGSAGRPGGAPAAVTGCSGAGDSTWNPSLRHRVGSRRPPRFLARLRLPAARFQGGLAPACCEIPPCSDASGPSGGPQLEASEVSAGSICVLACSALRGNGVPGPATHGPTPGSFGFRSDRSATSSCGCPRQGEKSLAIAAQQLRTQIRCGLEGIPLESDRRRWGPCAALVASVAGGRATTSGQFSCTGLDLPLQPR